MSAAPHSQHTRRKYERKSKLNLLDGNRLQNGSLISNYDLINFMAAVSEFCLASIIPAGFQVWPAFFFFFFYIFKMNLWQERHMKKRQEGSGGCRSEVRSGSSRSSRARPGRRGGQTLLGLTFFRLLSSSSSWRILTSLEVSSSFSRRSSSCCLKNIRRSCREGTTAEYTEADNHLRH